MLGSLHTGPEPTKYLLSLIMHPLHNCILAGMMSVYFHESYGRSNISLHDSAMDTCAASVAGGTFFMVSPTFLFKLAY